MAFDSIRELLFNVVKHAGVSVARLTCTYSDRVLTLRAQDQGKGFNLEETLSGHRFGLLNTLRRVELIGGQVSITTQPAGGTEVLLMFPGCLQDFSRIFSGCSDGSYWPCGI